MPKQEWLRYEKANTESFRLNEIQESLRAEAESAGLGDDPNSGEVDTDFDPFGVFADNEITTSNTGAEDDPDMD